MCSFLLCCCCFNSFTAYLGMQFKGKPRGGTQSRPSSDHITQVAKKLWGLLLGDLQKPPGHGPGPAAPGVSAGAEAGPDGQRGASQTQPFWDSVVTESFGFRSLQDLAFDHCFANPKAIWSNKNDFIMSFR